jgi:hypothetical protein
VTAGQLLARAAECQRCGREHKPWTDRRRPGYAPTWEDRKDGHAYYPRLPGSALRTLREIAAAA